MILTFSALKQENLQIYFLLDKKKKSKIRPRLERSKKDRNISKCLEMYVSKCYSRNICLEMSRNVLKCLEIKVQIKKGDKSPKRKRKYKSK